MLYVLDMLRFDLSATIAWLDIHLLKSIVPVTLEQSLVPWVFWQLFKHDWNVAQHYADEHRALRCCILKITRQAVELQR